MALLALEPHNPNLQGQVITELAKLGRPEIALPLVDTLIAQNPGDPQLLRSKWLLLLNAAAAADSTQRPGLFDRSVVAGEEMVKSDTVLADSTYWGRQIAAATGSSTPQRAVEFASRAVQKYPNSAEFWMLKGNAERKAGQLQMAEESIRRAVGIDPKVQGGMLLLTQINVELKRMDTVVAMVDRAVAAGEDPKTWGAFLLSPVQDIYREADAKDPKDIPGFERALTLAQKSDKLSPSATAKFFIGITSFQVGLDAIQQAQKPKSCPLARKGQDMFLLTQMNMPQGGAIDAKTAQMILGYTAQYAPTADQMVKAYCK
jgi:tetratricopeptide (TPR) repeat protein